VGVLSKRTGDAAVDEVLKRHGGPGA
jgi:hypothetical protein